ncbi:alpha-N-acetyl-neuraminyl-2,3-beta-galactosyl-1,3-N-acetyl-galactosaminide alpha-2,6-sialyltransferase-like isoform X2 [Acanthaster planci]|uniref:Alpha-N-acetyl-neuraminyl-2,3-beta-galactosyl-1, 3-N-acetyl-galactosaminide alpha-2,6-sialyltransferase-like isoform X2 n=1 Tax=Acanthaster planci TaxID=133434 RepID=A0A8B7Y2W5_ACAPL|nr:alpha-N-acetyl-neuraminyl-2,3-beta-galactosyl-1,3-N-acetyl-galactosaminide alpha-2,6-sialyltransferase-like isoform X2 [Acanthaster planci]
MATRWLPRNRCLTPHRFLLFALCYSVACLVCMTLFFDGEGSTQVKVRSKSGTTVRPSRGSDRGSDSNNGMSAKAGRLHVNWRQERTKDLFLRKGPDLALEDYQTLIGNKSVKFQCNQCAIVTSSGQLLGTGAGRQIDSNDCVIRMNNAPTKGFESDVGSRTTVRVIGHVNLRRIFANHPEAQEEFLVNASTRTDKIFMHWSFLTDIDRDPPQEYALALQLAKAYRNVSFNMFTPQKMVYAEKLFQHETGLSRSQAKTWLSTGWYTILLAIDSCKQINVFGMIYEDYCTEYPNKKIPYHYYNPSFKTECQYYHVSEVRLTSGHLFITEKAIFGRWANIHNIHFHYPRWPARSLRLGSQGVLTPFIQRYQISQNRFFSKLPYWKLIFHFSGLFYPLVH